LKAEAFACLESLFDAASHTGEKVVGLRITAVPIRVLSKGGGMRVSEPVKG